MLLCKTDYGNFWGNFPATKVPKNCKAGSKPHNLQYTR